ncbi:UNVERIFIED_CONTAM: hypothetical protein ABIC26_001929 [Paenibacillus sp. PvR008]
MNKKYEVRLEPKEHEWIEQLLHADSTSPGQQLISSSLHFDYIKLSLPSYTNTNIIYVLADYHR